MVELRREDVDEPVDVVRELEPVCLSGRHEEHARRFYLVLVRVDDVVSRALLEVQHLEEVVAVGVVHGEVSVRVEHLGLERSAALVLFAEALQAVNR